MNFKKVAKSYIRNCFYDVQDIFIQDKILLKNKDLKDKYKGKRLFILGSGGSIKLYDLKRLKDEYVMTQNNFHVHPDILEISPAFHCVVPYYQTDKELSVWIEWIKDMDKRLPNAQFFWGKNTKNLIDDNFNNMKNKSYYTSARYNLLTLNQAKVDISKTIMRLQTVTTQCITTAIYMGFSEIYLLGFDNDQICHERKEQNRFYGMSKITDTNAERNQLDKQRGQKVTLSWWNKWITSKQLDLLEIYSRKQNIKIINASNEGLLDNFKRESLKDIIGNDMLVKDIK